MNNDFCWVTVSKRAFDDEKLKRLTAYDPAGIRFNSGRNPLDWIEQKISKLITYGYPADRIFIDIGNKKTRVQTDERKMVVNGQFITIGKTNADLKIRDDGFLSSIECEDIVVFGDGQIECQVEQTRENIVKLKVLNNGEISNGTPVCTKGKSVRHFEIVDEREIQKIVDKHHVSLILSFVETVNNILRSERTFNTTIIPKIETIKAVENLDEIVQCSGKVIIGRGDLALAFGHEQIGKIQEYILKHTKEAIIATGSLISLLYGQVPTQAEIVDVTNSAMKAAGILLTDETAKAADPFLAIEWLDKIVNTAINPIYPRGHKSGMNSFD